MYEYKVSPGTSASRSMPRPCTCTWPTTPCIVLTVRMRTPNIHLRVHKVSPGSNTSRSMLRPCRIHTWYTTPCIVLIVRNRIPNIYIYKYHFNNFGGLVLFSLPPKRFFAHFLLRGTQKTRRYITRYVWVSRDVGGACTGRLKSLGLALFSGAVVRTKKAVTTTSKLEKEHFLAGCLPL